MLKTEPLLLTGGSVQISAATRTPTVTILAYSGGLMNVPGWGQIVIDLAGVDLSSSQVSILADHDATLKGVVGHGQAEVRNGKLLVAGTIMPSTDASKQIIDLAKSGFEFQASVGVAPNETANVRPGRRFEANGQIIEAPHNGCLFVKAGVLREVSIVVIGADAGTSVSIAASQKENLMTTEAPEVTTEEFREQAATDTERIAMIRGVCDGKYAEIEATAISEDWDENRVKLEVLRASRPRPPAIHSGRGYVAQPVVIEAAVFSHMGCETLPVEQLGLGALTRSAATTCATSTPTRATFSTSNCGLSPSHSD